MVLVVGADSGAHAGIALLTPGKPRPVLLEVWPVFGADHLWLGRATAACEAIVQRAASLGVPLSEIRFVVENPPKTGRADTLKGDRRGHTTWRGMGRRKGMLEGVWYAVTRQCAESVEQSDWTGRLKPRVKRKKVGDGAHRVLEAMEIVEGAGRALRQVRKSCRVDCAEAVLVAASELAR
jgi:hypothetical protein